MQYRTKENMYRKMFAIGAFALHALAWIVVASYDDTTAVFPIFGNAYPTGYHSVKLNIGRPSKEYHLRIESRSALTWVRETAPLDDQIIYNQTAINVSCMHPTCVSIQPGEIPNCGHIQNCRFELRYYNSNTTEEGKLYFDNVDLNLTNGHVHQTLLAIGSHGYVNHSSADGVLGIGKGSVGISHQLQKMNVIMYNVFAHCFSSVKGGYLTLGAILTHNNISWIRNDGIADLYFSNQSHPIYKSIQILFDSGSPYTYFSSQLYEDLLTQIKTDLGNRLEVMNGTSSLPVCWKVNAAKNIIAAVVDFKPLHFSFTNDDGNKKVSRYSMFPSSYLILLNKTMLCLGILDGSGVGIGHEVAVIGAISMVDKWIVYDNNETNPRVGWTWRTNCTKRPQLYHQ